MESEKQGDEEVFSSKKWWKVVWFAKDEFMVERIVYADEEEDALLMAFCSFKDTELCGGFWITIFMLDVESDLSKALVTHFPDDPNVGNLKWKKVSKRICKTLKYDDIVSIMKTLKNKKIIASRELPDGYVLTRNYQ